MERIIEGLEQFLSRELDAGRILASRTFYGAPFLRLFLSARGGLDAPRAAAIDLVEASLDRTSPEFHWEFVQYATLTFLHRTGESEPAEKLLPLRFKGTDVANWALLRAACKVKQGLLLGDHCLVQEGIEIAISTVRQRQLRSGLIADQVGVRSLQYHAFSTMLLLEIAQSSPSEDIRSSLDRAIGFARRHILRDGSCIYLGRGQNQLFGYAAILHLLSRLPCEDPARLPQINAILGMLEGYRRADGSLPLVLSGLEPAAPGLADLESEGFAGWYRYNNYFDYLPFFAHFLQEAKSALETTSSSEPPPPRTDFDPSDWFDGTNLVVRRADYEAVVARPVGSASNWMPQPFFGQSLPVYPIFGGEEFFSSTFHKADLPLPRTAVFGWSMARFLRSFWIGRTLLCLSPLGIVVRRFRFDPQQVSMVSLVFPPWILKDQFCFPEGAHLDSPAAQSPSQVAIQAFPQLKFSHSAYSAGGKYSVFTSRSPRTKITWHFPQAKA